jgi:hypothetical protein
LVRISQRIGIDRVPREVRTPALRDYLDEVVS